MLMIAIICSIVGVIVFGGAIGYFLYKKFSRHIVPTTQADSNGMKALEQSSKAEIGNN